jgi:hypothetical protein
VLLRLVALARAPVEPFETQVAVDGEGAHAARFGEGQRVVILSLGALGIEPIRMTRDGAQQLQSLDCSTRVAGKGLNDVVGQPLRLVKAAERESGRNRTSSSPAHATCGIGCP